MSARSSGPGPALDLDRVLVAFESDPEAHVTNGPCPEDELAHVETVIGAPLPALLRHFLRRLGGGLYSQGHEIFGTRRVMIHDIELVPDILSMRAQVAREGRDPVAEGLLPFHRFVQGVHLIRLGPEGGEVVAREGGARYPDLVSFLEAVVLSRRTS